VWVEGITDRWYFRSMLQSYIKFLQKSNIFVRNIEEGIHYSFVEYGGGNITHWSFLDEEEHPIAIDKLCARALVIIDQDGIDTKLERKDKLQEFLKERLIILPCREVENSLPSEVILGVVEEYERSSINILKDIDYESYQNLPLGNFIEEHILQNATPKRRGGYAEQSGTIKDKRAFCERAIKFIDYENLPLSTQRVIEKIYKFIVEKNYG
jgi:hypothetical protein